MRNTKANFPAALPLFLITGAVVLAGPTELGAVNRFFIENETITLDGSNPVVPVYLQNDIPLLGFSVHLRYDTRKIRILSVENGLATTNMVSGRPGPCTDTTGADDCITWGAPDNAAGDLHYGVVFKINGPFPQLPVGNRHEILRLTLEVRVTGADTTVLDLVDQPGVPNRFNTMTDGSGDSVPSPGLQDATLTFQDLSPVIDNLLSNDVPDGAPDSIFFIIGRNFNQPGLAVTVGGRNADARLLPGDTEPRTIQVTAPACDSEGWAPARVQTNFGSASATNGFNYKRCGPPVPQITSLVQNRGCADDRFFVTVANRDSAPNLRVLVCGVPAEFQPLGDAESINVTAPECGATGWAAIEVRNDNGADSRPQGFFYEDDCVVQFTFVRGNPNDDPGVDITDGIFILSFLFLGERAPRCRDAADANDNGTVDLSDAIHVFNYLFLGGPEPPPPFQDANRNFVPGVDPTADRLPECTGPLP